LGKWLWRYAHEEEAWWKTIFGAKYGSVWGGWRSRDLPGPHVVGLWKHISKGSRLFHCDIRFDTGIGSKIRFWEDVWCGDMSLKDAFLAFLIFPESRMHLLLITVSDQMILFNGMLLSLTGTQLGSEGFGIFLHTLVFM
jgi:hypothetical protein